MNINLQLTQEIFTDIDFRTSSLIIIPFIITIVLFIIIPIIGFFSGYRRALYWSVGNWIFILIGWGIFALAGDSMAQLISKFIADTMLSVIPNSSSISSSDILPVVKELLAPIFYLLILFLSNAILLCFYYLFAKKLLSITKHKAKIKAIKNTNFFVKYQIASKLSGSVSMVIIGMPIIANVSQISYAVTTSYLTRDPEFNPSVSEGVGKMSMNLYNFTNSICKYNPTNYWQPIDQTIDATISLFDFVINDTFVNSIKNMGSFYVFVANRTIKGPIIKVEEDTILNECFNKWIALIQPSIAIQYSNILNTKSTLATTTNIMRKYSDSEKKLDPKDYKFDEIENNVNDLKDWTVTKNMPKINVDRSSYNIFNSALKQVIFLYDESKSIKIDDFINNMGEIFFTISK